MINGCYYRLVVVYELAQKVGTSTVALVIPKDEIEYKRIAEVYEFYVVDKNEHIEPLASNTKRYSLGETVLVSDFASYSGSKEISKGDLHYGWKLGKPRLFGLYLLKPTWMRRVKSGSDLRTSQ